MTNKGNRLFYEVPGWSTKLQFGSPPPPPPILSFPQHHLHSLSSSTPPPTINKLARRPSASTTSAPKEPRHFSKENRKCNETNRTKELMEARDILRENPEDADALAIFADYNPQYEGKTIEKGVGVSRNVPGTVRIDSKGRQVTIRADVSKPIKARGSCLVNTDTNVAEAGNNFGREVFESDKCGISFNTYKDLQEVEGAAEEAGIMPKSLRIRYRDLQSIKLRPS
ncbi:hypothetical protein BKA61DRAFT_660661 [Leptodontidium sp. MPI-SDFR-AT-0119]|nr:hypothetical protein BKA61DRAFT_660661 [Leptodontidium sp. MPI-SDFR-AT-0119]